MITLDSNYQYIGRSNAVRAVGIDFFFYLLLYAKTTGDPTTGKHTVDLKMRLACTDDIIFGTWFTNGVATVDGQSAIAWQNQKKPGATWSPKTEFVEGGLTFIRWSDMAEGSVEVDTEYGQKEVTLTAEWQRRADNRRAPYWMASTTKATIGLKVLLPSIVAEGPEAPQPEPEPGPANQLPDGVRIYADGVIVSDSRLEDHDLMGLTITHGLNVGGTAEIVMPWGHPAYDSFVSHKTIVTIYRNGLLRFRGRALYSAENFFNQRTVTCEGELCFLRDTITRPYLYQASPRSCFVTLINQHNSQTDPEKQFKVGMVTVEDANDYVRLESESAETTMDTMNKLLERCGGYIMFTTDEDGSRVINWLASLNNRSNQLIEFGENLLDFSSTGANTTNLATGLIPYGAKDEKTKKRLTIESVNGGKDYILAEDAIAIRGTIMATATWDDVTDATNLLKKAKALLEERKVFITSLQLTALDLSQLDKRLDSFTVGDKVRVVSAPHGVNTDFQLSQMTENLLNPAQSTIILGKDLQSLTGADVAGDKLSQSELATVKVLAGQSPDLSGFVTEEQLTGFVTAESLQGYATKEQLQAYATAAQLAEYAKTEALNTEVNARAGVINKVDGVVNISGGAPIKMLGGKVDIDGSEIHFGKEARFKNESGVRINDKDGNAYYTLRVDASNNCFVGNDYCNLYLRGKDAVYLHKTGAAVTSDRRHKNSIEPLPEAYEALLDTLEPVRFRYNDHGDRYHVGFVAQDVEQALENVGLAPADFGGLVDVSGDGSNLGLAYDEFIGLLLHKIRKLEKRIEALEE